MKGFPKALLEIGGRKFIEIIIEKSKDAGATDIVVVVGAHADEIKKSVNPTGVKIEVNAKWREGQLSSLRAGIVALDEKSEGFLLAPCDSPEVSAETYKMLSNAWEKDKSKIFIPVSREGRGGHPTIFPRRFYRELLENELTMGAKTLIEKHPRDIIRIETDDEGILSDIDTREDYLKINTSVR